MDEKQTASFSDLVSLGETWKRQLQQAERTDKDWIERGKKVVKRYRDERSEHNTEKRFNILWSNIQTMFPAMYARTPRVEVSRRNKDSDPIARTAAIILERCIQYELDQYEDFDEAMRLCVMDRLLPGRGTAWVRFEEQEVATVDAPEGAEDPEAYIEPEVITQERSVVDYVYWEDFRYSPSRVWAEVTWVAKRVYLSRQEVIDQFGREFADVPLCHVPIGIEEEHSEHLQKAKVWEIWDKGTKQVIWIAEGYDKALRVIDDPLGLDGFFPCPRPLFATQTTDSLVPIPDYALYQDQAVELDMLTQKIGQLTEALKVAGLYDGSQPEIQRLLTSGNNEMIGVQNWAAYMQNGGTGGSTDWFPVEQITKTLAQLYVAREEAKQIVYEVMGISDIARGATKASETYGAQRLKSQYGSIRMSPRQKEVAQFASEILRIKAQMMMDLYSPRTLAEMSGVENTPDGEGINQALALMKTEPLRSYRIEVAADSLIEVDQEAEREQRVEFLGAASTFLREAMQVVQAAPQMTPLLAEMLMFGVRGFKAGREMEAQFEQTMQQLQQPQEQSGPSPEEMQMQAEQAKLQQQMQIEQAKIQADQQIQQARIQADVQVKQAQAELQARLESERAQRQMEVDQNRAQAQLQQQAMAEQQKMEFERWKAELDAATRIQIAQMQSAAQGVVQIDPATEAATDEIAREVQP